jgi:hypothetical protein
MNDETNNSFILNQSLDRMDIDDNNHDLITPASTMVNGHISSSSHSIENENKKDIFHQGYNNYLFLKLNYHFSFYFRNPMLNKSFDVLPQVKDDNTHSDDHVSNKISKLSDKNIIF